MERVQKDTPEQFKQGRTIWDLPDVEARRHRFIPLWMGFAFLFCISIVLAPLGMIMILMGMKRAREHNLWKAERKLARKAARDAVG